MAEAKEIDVPGVGNVKSTYVVVAAAAAGGFVLFAWWRRRSSNEVPGMIPVVDPSQIPATDYVPPSGGGATGHQDLTGDAITTNAEWFRAAEEHLGRSGGWEPKFIATALGAFLDRQEVSEDQAQLIRSARGAVGDPPVNGPWTIKVGVGTAPERTLSKVKNLRVIGATRTHVTLAWDPVPNATRYKIDLQGRTGVHPAVFDYSTAPTYSSGPLPRPDFDYIFTVFAQRDDENGPSTQITGRTAP